MKLTISKTKIEKAFFIFMLLYSIVLPNSSFSIFIFMFAMLLVYNFLVFKNRINISKKDFILITVFFLMICISTIFGIMVKPNIAYSITSFEIIEFNVPLIDIRYMLYFLFGGLVFRTTNVIYSKYGRTFVLNSIKKVCVLVVVMFVITFFISRIDEDFFYLFRNLYFNGNADLRDSEVLQNAGYFKRFNFIFLDVNNCGYFITMICIFQLMNIKKMRVVEKTLYYIALFLAPFATQSRGTLIAVVIFFVCINVINLIRQLTYGRLNILYFFCLISLITFLSMVFYDLYTSEFVQISSNTLLSRVLGDTGDGRGEIWKAFVNKEGFPPFIGKGYSLINESLYMKVHSDHLRLLYGYGTISYLFLFLFFCRKKYFNKNFLFILPVFIAITLNSLIDEQRFLFTFLILFCYLYMECNNKIKLNTIERIKL